MKAAPNPADQVRARRARGFGLLLLALLVLVVILLRAPAHVLFPAGWWRL